MKLSPVNTRLVLTWLCCPGQFQLHFILCFSPFGCISVALPVLSLPAVQPQPKGGHSHPSCSTAFPACWQPVLDRALLTGSCVRRGGRCPSPGLPFPDGASPSSLNSSFPPLSPGRAPPALKARCDLSFAALARSEPGRVLRLCFAACDARVPQPSRTPASRGCHMAVPAPRGTVWGLSLRVPALGGLPRVTPKVPVEALCSERTWWLREVLVSRYMQ